MFQFKIKLSQGDVFYGGADALDQTANQFSPAPRQQPAAQLNFRYNSSYYTLSICWLIIILGHHPYKVIKPIPTSTLQTHSEITSSIHHITTHHQATTTQTTYHLSIHLLLMSYLSIIRVASIMVSEILPQTYSFKQWHLPRWKRTWCHCRRPSHSK